MPVNKTAAAWGITVSMLVVIGVLIVLAAIEKTRQPYGVELAKLTAQAVDVGTTTSFTDTNTNTWAFAMNSFSVLEYTWKRPEFNPKVVWDSQLGSCGKNQANYISMTTNVSVSTRTEGITLAQTPMFLDANGVQRTFRLQLYNADVRIESTNGDGRFWSVFGTNITLPVSWPSTITNGLDPLWQSGAPPNLTFYAQFLTNGDLVNQQPNGVYQTFSAKSWSNPIC
jgi:hypothetical protein